MIKVDGVTIFSSEEDADANQKFLDWKEQHKLYQDVLYLNIRTSTTAKIHRADCIHAHNDKPDEGGDNARHPKACCLTGHGRLREFATKNNLDVTTCKTCKVHW